MAIENASGQQHRYGDDLSGDQQFYDVLHSESPCGFCQLSFLDGIEI